MKYGTKEDLEKFLEKYKDDTTRTARVQSQLEWARPDRWFVREATDGPVETQIIELLKNSDKFPSIKDIVVTTNPLRSEESRRIRAQPVPVVVNPTVNRKPPARKPPSRWGKVKQYWDAITGPRVDQATFDSRLAECTKRAGYSWSPITGEVTSVDGNLITINDSVIVKLLPDEETLVAKGDFVTDGQVIAKGVVDKPCQFLVNNKGKIHCGACGCGDRSKAELNNKLWYATVECPRNPPRFKRTDGK